VSLGQIFGNSVLVLIGIGVVWLIAVAKQIGKQQAELIHASDLAFQRESGKNLATKADIAEITGKIEAVKLEYGRQLERTKGTLTAQIAQYSFRYQKEFEILIELAALLYEIEYESTSLRPAYAMSDRKNEPAESRSSRVQNVNKLLIDLDELAKRRRPFFCEKVFDAIDELLDEVDREAVRYQNGVPEGGQPLWWYLEGNEAGRRIRELAQVASHAIRTRTKSWDQIEASQVVN